MQQAHVHNLFSPSFGFALSLSQLYMTSASSLALLNRVRQEFPRICAQQLSRIQKIIHDTLAKLLGSSRPARKDVSWSEIMETSRLLYIGVRFSSFKGDDGR